MKLGKGDKVTIKSLEWFDSNKRYSDLFGWCVDLTDEGYAFTENMIAFCDKVATIEDVRVEGGSRKQETYTIDLDDGEYGWTPSMFSGHFKESNLTTLLFGDCYILADMSEGKCVPEFFASLEDVEIYKQKVGS